MEVLYLLIPLAVVLAGVIVWFFLWAIRSGQFDDLEGPAWRILMDDDEPRHERGEDNGQRRQADSGRDAERGAASGGEGRRREQ